MRISVILGHPCPGSFCHAIADTARERLTALGHTVTFHDLQAEGFDPVAAPDEFATLAFTDALVERHCAEIAAADGLVVVHPVWWGGPPAILKGWIDRVIRRGVAFDVGPGPEDSRMGLVGRLRVRAAAVFYTAETPPEIEERVFRNSVDVLWKAYVGAMSGIPLLERHPFRVTGTGTREMRAAWLTNVADTLIRLFPADAPAGSAPASKVS